MSLKESSLLLNIRKETKGDGRLVYPIEGIQEGVTITPFDMDKEGLDEILDLLTDSQRQRVLSELDMKGGSSIIEDIQGVFLVENPDVDIINLSDEAERTRVEGLLISSITSLQILEVHYIKEFLNSCLIKIQDKRIIDLLASQLVAWKVDCLGFKLVPRRIQNDLKKGIFVTALEEDSYSSPFILFNNKKVMYKDFLGILGKFLSENKFTDVSFSVNCPPIYRKGTYFMPDKRKLSSFELESIYSLIFKSSKMESGRVVISVPGIGRLRCTCIIQRSSPYINIRLLSASTYPLSDYGYLNTYADKISEIQNGLILISGPPGSRKNSACVSTIVNLFLSGHSIRKVDEVGYPIETLIQHNSGMMNQIDVGIDIPSYREAANLLRTMDLDVVYITEVRSPEEAKIVLDLIGLGRLVLATIHGKDNYEALAKLVNFTDNPKASFLNLQDSLRLALNQNLNASNDLEQELLLLPKGSSLPKEFLDEKGGRAAFETFKRNSGSIFEVSYSKA